jgi:hypothetical protein
MKSISSFTENRIFEAQFTTLEELKNWTLSTFNKEIERRANEKFNAIATGTYGVLDFVTKKITSRFSNQQSGQQ